MLTEISDEVSCTLEWNNKKLPRNVVVHFQIEPRYRQSNFSVLLYGVSPKQNMLIKVLHFQILFYLYEYNFSRTNQLHKKIKPAARRNHP